MDFEKVIYEFKPFICIGLAVYALFTPNPPSILIGSSILLLSAGALILRARMKARSKGEGIEKLFYEFQPYLYIALGIYALYNQSTSKLAVISSVVLLVCAAIILKWRVDYRRERK